MHNVCHGMISGVGSGGSRPHFVSRFLLTAQFSQRLHACVHSARRPIHVWCCAMVSSSLCSPGCINVKWHHSADLCCECLGKQILSFLGMSHWVYRRMSAASQCKVLDVSWTCFVVLCLSFDKTLAPCGREDIQLETVLPHSLIHSRTECFGRSFFFCQF